MPADFPSLTQRKIFSVSELISAISGLLDAHFGALFLEGEISNVRQPASGHLYLTLKDATAQIKGIVFRRQRMLLDFTPEEGMQVLCRGHITIYEPRGDLQVIIDWMEPSGRGASHIALEKLKKKLAAEGLFEESRKKPLPILPQTIGVITSPTGAAIRDILKVIKKKNENVRVLLYPARVQGEQAPDEIVEGITFFNRHKLADVLIVGRGGGSIEDLEAFNTEKVVQAIAASDIPIISAVGHEIDFTLSDLAADKRAPTPTAAAEIVILEREQWIGKLDTYRKRLIGAFQLILQRKRFILQQAASKLTDPRHRLSLIRMQLDDAFTRLSAAVTRSFQVKRHILDTMFHRLQPFNPLKILPSLRENLEALLAHLQKGIAHTLQVRRASIAGLSALLDSYNPKNVLQRGYSITIREVDGTIVKKSNAVTEGENIRVQLFEGTLGCEVKRRVSS